MTEIWNFVSSRAPLTPGSAVAAILIHEDGRYFLQHRDPKPTIWYPDHWGCFGGAVEPGEDDVAALKRELVEEIGWAPAEATYFTSFDFDLSFAGGRKYYRRYYTAVLPLALLPGLVLREGSEMRSFSADELFSLARVTPYDSFALWLHHARDRISAGVGA